MRRLLLAAFLLAVPLHAHDFWIEPSTFRPAAGAMVSLSLLQGEQFVGDPVPRVAERIDRFVIRDAKGERAVGGFEGRDPAGVVRVENAGLQVIGYRTKPKRNEPQPAEKFEQYLREEGQEAIVQLRARRGHSARPGLELFSRSAKSLLYVSGGKSGGHDQPLGFRLELVPLTNPYVANDARAMDVRLLWEGRPLADALTVALHHDDPSMRVAARTARDGRVTFKLPKAGIWMIKSVHVVPAKSGTDAEWESVWASLTFEWGAK